VEPDPPQSTFIQTLTILNPSSRNRAFVPFLHL
jgi:hypothetical protein